MQFNSRSRNPTPTQDNVGDPYTAAMDGAPGNTTIHRKGVVTMLNLTGNLTASRTLTFGTVVNEGWLPGDEVFISAPTHTGGGYTIAVTNIAASTLCTWPALLANGGHFVFVGSDFVAVNPGQSTT